MTVSPQKLVDLSPSVCYASPVHEGKESKVKEVAQEPDAPALMVLFGWMNASTKHLAKYINGYNDLFPASPILLVQTTAPSLLFKSEKFRISEITKVTDHLLEQGLLGQEGRKRMLIHAFSNGGVAQMTAVAQQIRMREDTRAVIEGGAALAPAALILDSCPGSSSFKIILTSFTKPFRYRFARWAMYPIVAFLHICSLKRFLTLLLLRAPTLHPADKVAALLQDPSLLARLTRRTYIYSHEDATVDFAAVESHANAARCVGVRVRLERFEGSMHVTHERLDSKRYWKIIEAAWQAAHDDLYEAKPTDEPSSAKQPVVEATSDDPLPAHPVEAVTDSIPAKTAMLNESDVRTLLSAAVES